MHVSVEDWGDGGIVNWLSSEMKSHPEYMRSFLELLTVLPQVYLFEVSTFFICAENNITGHQDHKTENRIKKVVLAEAMLHSASLHTASCRFVCTGYSGDNVLFSSLCAL